MKKLLSCLFAVMLLILAASCGASEPQNTGFDEELLRADAEATADALLNGDYEAVCAKFDDTMAGVLDAATLEQGWLSAVSGLGSYMERAAVSGAVADPYYAVNVDEQFEKNGVRIHIVYDTDGKIAGLQCTYVDLSEPVTSDLYTETEVTVTGDATMPLGATLTLPTGVENPPVVILVHGSGASDRNENIYGNKPFQDIAHGLAEKGIATLRYDKRHYTYPENAAALSVITMRDEVLDDVAAAVKLMQEDGRVDADHIYVLGHSLGGMLTPAIAAEHPDLAGVISMAGSLRPLWEIAYNQSEEAIEAAKASDLPEAQQTLLAAQEKQIESDISTLRGDFSSLSNDTVLMGIPVGYWKSLKEYDGMNFIDQVSMPMLILQGSADFQVYPDKDYTLWQQTIGERKNVTFHLYDGLNHLMMPTQGKRDISEYQVIQNVSPEVISDIAAFVSQQG